MSRLEENSLTRNIITSTEAFVLFEVSNFWCFIIFMDFSDIASSYKDFLISI